MDVVVVGGGIAGAFTGLFLRRLGANVKIVELPVKYPRNGLIVSPYLPNAIDVDLVLRSLEIYREIGTRIFRVPTLIIKRPGRDEAKGYWSRKGIEYRVVDESFVRAHGFQPLGGEEYIYGHDFIVDVRTAVSRAKRGLAIVRGRASLSVSRNRAQVCVDGKYLKADRVVLAAGAQNAALASDAGVWLPLKPYCCIASVVLGAPEYSRVVLGDYVLEFYSRPLVPPLAALGLAVLGDGNMWCSGAARASLAPLLDRARRRLARKRRVRSLKMRIGMCEGSADMMPVIGRHHTVDNLYVIGGLNGYGAHVGPALAELLADAVYGDTDAPIYALSRFAYRARVEPDLMREPYKF